MFCGTVTLVLALAASSQGQAVGIPYNRAAEIGGGYAEASGPQAANRVAASIVGEPQIPIQEAQPTPSPSATPTGTNEAAGEGASPAESPAQEGYPTPAEPPSPAGFQIPIEQAAPHQASTAGSAANAQATASVPSEGTDAERSDRILTALLAIFCVIGAFTLWCGVAEVRYCHNNGLGVYARSSDLFWSSYGGATLVLLASILGQKGGDLINLAALSAVVIGWWWLQHRRAKTLNPEATGGQVFRVMLARVGASGVVLGLSGLLVMALGKKPRRDASDAEQILVAVEKVAFMAMVGGLAWRYVGFVCEPDRRSYPNSAFARARQIS